MEATLGVSGEPRYAFEMLQDGVHVAVLDMVQLGQMRCPTRDNDRSGGPVLVRDGIVTAQLSTAPRTFLNSGRPEVQSARTSGNGPAPLPLAAGLGTALAAVANVNTRATGQHRITCVDYSHSADSTEGAIQSVVIAPFILFRPAENRSRQLAQIHGTELYDSIILGQDLPSDFEAHAQETRVGVRAHAGDGGYQVMTIDLGGGRTNGVAQPRSVGYIGIRNGVVEWKALDATGQTLSDMLCISADGRRGRIRPGCSSTGFYLP